MRIVIAVSASAAVLLSACPGPSTPQESPPEMTSVNITPDPAYPNDTLTCTGKADDADGDTVTFDYTWEVNGDPTPGNGQELSADAIERDDEVSCTATPHAGTVSGEPMTAQITIGAYQLSIEDGDEQTGTVAWSLPNDLVVEVADGEGNGVSGVSVTWAALDGDGSSVAHPTRTSGSEGLAETTVTLGVVAGEYTFRASLTDDPSTQVTFSADATVDGLQLSIHDGDNQTGLLGTQLDNALKVEVHNQDDHPLEGISIDWEALDGNNSSVSTNSSSTNAQGLAQVLATLGEVAGLYTFRASLTDDATNQVTFTAEAQSLVPTVLIEAGTDELGCTEGQSDCEDNEDPSHDVTLTRDFLMAETQVTQAQFDELMGYNPSWHVGCPECPVERVDWDESAAFANALSATEGLDACYACTGTATDVDCEEASTYTGENMYDCPGYRLPTEAEWEFAARCGEDLLYAGSNVLDDVGWYDGNSGSQTHPVAQKSPNACGLYDMSGNVWEWTQDRWYRAYTASPVTDPLHASGSEHVVRGGSYWDSAALTRLSRRLNYHPGYRQGHIGFRIVRTAP